MWAKRASIFSVHLYNAAHPTPTVPGTPSPTKSPKFLCIISHTTRKGNSSEIPVVREFHYADDASPFKIQKHFYSRLMKLTANIRASIRGARAPQTRQLARTRFRGIFCGRNKLFLCTLLIREDTLCQLMRELTIDAMG